ncbi:MAG: cell division protein FtsZ [Minisyncoccales bacterium]
MTKKIKKKPKKKIKKKISQPIKKLKPEKTQLEGDTIKRTKIRLIGLGGGGCNIVSEIAGQIGKASFVLANTDLKALKIGSRRTIKFLFGQNLTHHLGTGMNPELGRAAAESEKEKIKKICQGQDLCILVAALGGGTGSGAITTFARVCKNLGNLTYGIFTLPFKFEGEKKMEIALNALKEVKNHLNILSIIPNERVFQVIDKDTPLKEALSAINKFLAESLGGLIETLYGPGLINIDFADFRTILQGRGRLAYLNTVEVSRNEKKKEENNLIKEAIIKVLNSPFYPYTMRSARGVLFNIIGEKDISLANVNYISKSIAELASSEAKIIFGVAPNKKQSDKIKIMLLATGCGAKFLSNGEQDKKTKKKASPKKPPKKSLSVEAKKETKLKTKKKTTKRKQKKTSSSGQKIKIKVDLKTSKQDQPSEIKNKEEIRRNGLEVKREIEEMEKEIIEKEKIWETPAFLRKKFFNNK